MGLFFKNYLELFQGGDRHTQPIQKNHLSELIFVLNHIKLYLVSDLSCEIVQLFSRLKVKGCSSREKTSEETNTAPLNLGWDFGAHRKMDSFKDTHRLAMSNAWFAAL